MLIYETKWTHLELEQKQIRHCNNGQIWMLTIGWFGAVDLTEWSDRYVGLVGCENLRLFSTVHSHTEQKQPGDAVLSCLTQRSPFSAVVAGLAQQNMWWNGFDSIAQSVTE